MLAQFAIAHRLAFALLVVPLLATLFVPTAAQVIDADGDGLYDADDAP
jgi:hypothetical protein